MYTNFCLKYQGNACNVTWHTLQAGKNLTTKCFTDKLNVAVSIHFILVVGLPIKVRTMLVEVMIDMNLCFREFQTVNYVRLRTIKNPLRAELICYFMVEVYF